MADPISVGAASISIIDYLIRIGKKIPFIFKGKYILRIKLNGEIKNSKRSFNRIITKCMTSSKRLNKLRIVLYEDRKALIDVKPIYREISANELFEKEKKIRFGISILLSNEVKEMYGFLKLEDKITKIVSDYIKRVQNSFTEFNFREYTQLDIFQTINGNDINVVFPIKNDVLQRILNDKHASIDSLRIPRFLEFNELRRYIEIEDFISKMLFEITFFEDINDLPPKNYAKFFSEYNWHVGLH
jgi:hypothetical protein